MPDLTLSVPTISCGHCKKTIELAVSAVPGVKSVHASIEDRVVDVDFVGQPNVDAVVAAVEQSHPVEGVG